VDGDHLDLVSVVIFIKSPQDVAADSAKTVNCDADGHDSGSFCRVLLLVVVSNVVNITTKNEQMNAEQLDSRKKVSKLTSKCSQLIIKTDKGDRHASHHHQGDRANHSAQPVKPPGLPESYDCPQGSVSPSQLPVLRQSGAWLCGLQPG